MHDSRLRWLITIIVAFAVMPAAGAESPPWHTRLAEAQKAAREGGRPILAFFTDSAKCPWCAKLSKDVLQSPEFQRWAAGSVVLLELDFAAGKPQDPAVREQNESLKQSFGVRSYPMVVFMSADLKELGRIPGYPKEAKTPDKAREKWIAQAKAIVAKGG